MPPERCRHLPLSLIALLCLGAFAAPAVGAERLKQLRSGLKEAMERLERPIADLNASYSNALGRLRETETAAGNLDRVLAIQREQEALAESKRFDAASLEARLSDFDGLRRLQSTYLAERSRLEGEIAPAKRELAVRFDQALDLLQSELTRENRLEEALELRSEQKRFRMNPEFARFFGDDGEDSPGFRGKAVFVTKGEIELFVNGEALDFQNLYGGGDADLRVTGHSQVREFRAGDVILIRAKSRAVFRGIAIGMVSESGSVHVPVRIEHLRKLRARTAPGRVTAAMIEEAAEGGITPGATDALMGQELRSLGLPPPESGGSEWFQGDAADEWHAWGFILSPEMFVTAGGGSS